ncbi:MAG TPA: hypothetical protein VNN79_17135, partial [Actinomycetota bacterium]|nr:hypothetical protein [Actinomycetota bacterium]
MRLRGVLAVAFTVALVMSAVPAEASVAIRTVVAYNPAAGEFPEGLAVDKRGNIYTSLVEPAGEIRVLRPNGAQAVIAHFPVSGFGPLGLAVDPPGNLF